MALSSNRRQRGKLARWLPVLFFWLFQVALTSTASGPPGHQFTRQESIEKSLLAWGVWALLAPLIVGIDRWLPLSRDAIFKRFLVHIPFSLFFTGLNLYSDALITSLLNSQLKPFPLPYDVISDSMGGMFQARFVVYWVVLFAYITMDYADHLKEREIRTAELENLVSEARLDVLRAKLHPHFLFNTLNTISAHVEREPRTARRLLEQLGELLRLSLAHSEDQEIPLAQEIAFIERYLELQKARLDDRLEATLDVDPDVLDALVPTFILQPLVENAIRHGAAPRFEQGLVQVRAWRTNGQLHLTVQDDGPGLPPGWDPEESAGIGISNTRERLRHLYGDRHQNFEISSDAGKGVRVDLSFPFRDSNTSPLAL
ncbi:MAG TPA: histidine kinase [Bryobacteraceae bacterium]|nr:histidine kinase [Bryobacteraceae bacterium]